MESIKQQLSALSYEELREVFKMTQDLVKECEIRRREDLWKNIKKAVVKYEEEFGDIYVDVIDPDGVIQLDRLDSPGVLTLAY